MRLNHNAEASVCVEGMCWIRISSIALIIPAGCLAQNIPLPEADILSYMSVLMRI